MHLSIIAIENHDHAINSKTLLKTNITLDALPSNKKSTDTSAATDGKKIIYITIIILVTSSNTMIVINAMQFIEALRNLSYVQ